MSNTFQPASNPSIVQSQPARQPGRAHVLVIGNEKGGSGKSTTALHIAVALMADGARVATLDLDLLARVDPDTLKILRPSIYAEAVWKQRQIRAVQGGRPVDWIVMRNRLSSLAARNKRDMATVIDALAKRIGFRVAAGLSERVIYKELFLNGLTLFDLKRGNGGPSLTLSHVAARQEVRDLVASLNLPRRDADAPSAEPATDQATEAPRAAE